MSKASICSFLREIIGIFLFSLHPSTIYRCRPNVGLCVCAREVSGSVRRLLFEQLMGDLKIDLKFEIKEYFGGERTYPMNEIARDYTET